MAALFVGRHTDADFVTYRYARNLAAGLGFAYNIGERVLSDAVSPGHVALLALVSRGGDVPLAGQMVGTVSIGVGALALYLLGRETHPLVGGAAAGVYAAFPLLWESLGSVGPLWMALALLAIWAHIQEWAVVAALLLALGTLVRPEAAVLAVILLASAVATGRKLNPLAAGAYAAVLAIGLVWIGSMLDAGGALPVPPGVGGSVAPPGMLASGVGAGLALLAAGTFALSPLWTAGAILAVPGAVRARDTHWALVLVGWALLHIVILTVLGAAAAHWMLAPVVAAWAALIALGGAFIVGRLGTDGLRWAVGGICTLLVAGAAGDSLVRMQTAPAETAPWQAVRPPAISSADVAAGDWLLNNTAPEAWVGSTRVGVLGYVSNRRMLDYYGTLQPDIAAARARNASGWWLAAHRPEVVVLRGAELNGLDGWVPASDRWFGSTYTEVARFTGADEEQAVIFRRVADPLALTERLVGMVSYGNGLVLNGIATDFELEPLDEGQVGRVRLEWLLEEPLDGERYVAIGVQHRSGSFAALNGRMVDFGAWPTRRLLTTYHTIELLPGPPAGVYEVRVGVGWDANNLAWQTLTTAKVPFSTSVYVGGLSGTRAEFGEVALQGYRLSRTPPSALEVLLLWEAIQAPSADYQVLLQVRDAAGAIVTQQQAEPYGGDYPTSIWSAGEQVPDSYTLDIGGLPPAEYEVYAGLLDADGQRLLTLDGRDAVMVGRVVVEE